MNRLRPAAIIAALVMAVGLIAGCAQANGLTPAAATVADPKADLKEAITKLATTTSTINVQVTGAPIAATATGQLDPKGGNAAITFTAAGHAIEFRALPDALYVKLGDVAALAGLPVNGWVKLDKARLIGSLGNVIKPEQAIGAASALDGAVTVTNTGPGQFKGTLDVSKLRGPLGVARDGADAVVPFTATVNADGYLTGLTITAKRITATVSFTDFGKAVQVSAPPAKDVTNAPDIVYNALSGLGK
jgi:hypothetical protein